MDKAQKAKILEGLDPETRETMEAITSAIEEGTKSEAAMIMISTTLVLASKALLSKTKPLNHHSFCDMVLAGVEFVVLAAKLEFVTAHLKTPLSPIKAALIGMELAKQLDEKQSHMQNLVSLVKDSK